MNNPDALSLTQERSLRIPDQKQLEPLLRSLDSIIYVLFATVFLCDNLSLLLLLRVVNQIVHIQSTATTPQLPQTILVNLGCIIAHLIREQPTGTRLYGGILIDFVGEVSPSRSRILFLDFTIFALQLVMLVARHEKSRTSDDEKTPDVTPVQDLESEEAGRRRGQSDAAETENGIEMQSLLSDHTAENGLAAQKHVPEPQDDDLITLDMRRGLKALFRRPVPADIPAASDDNAARATLATFLARVAAARGGGR
jgi:hypothetical protein